MKKLIGYLILNMISLLVVSKVISGIYIDSISTLLVLAIVIGILNATLKPILNLLSLPVTFMTLGLFILIINGLVLSLAFLLVDGAAIYSFGTAVVASVVLSVVNWFLNAIFGDD